MPVHEKHLLLPWGCDAEGNIPLAIAILSQNHARTEYFLNLMRRSISHSEFYSLLLMLDLKHHAGYLISDILEKQFGGVMASFAEYVFEELPCRICGQLVPAADILNLHYGREDNQRYFAEKFLCDSMVEPQQQLNYYRTYKTARFLQEATVDYAKTSNKRPPGDTASSVIVVDVASGKIAPIVL